MAEHAIKEELGKRIQELRRQQNLTLEALADRSGVSRAMLSKIERGEKNPTVAVALRIAKALAVSLFELLGEVEERRSLVIIPASKRMIVRDSDTGFERQLLSPTFEGGSVEFMRHLIPPGSSSGELAASRQKGLEKYIVVEKGKLHVVIGADSYHLEEGDAMYYKADVTHRYENAGKGVCSYFIVVSRARG
jgi:transcriptional regulator with XRE-family HTH domain